MDEALEPQDMVERTVHQHHELQHPEDTAPKRAAVAAATLAVCAALGSLLAGHAANEAILDQTRASDQWSYYQAKSTKVQIFDADRQLVDSLASLNGKTNEPKVQRILSSLSNQEKKYNGQKVSIGNDARKLEDESAIEFRRHEDFAVGIAFFQIGIVLCSVYIMMRRNWLYMGSVAAGLLGVMGLVVGLIT